jgi:hypothetical protein
MSQQNITRLIIRAIMLVLLIAAMNGLPYGYYKIANTCICLGFIGLIILDVQRKVILLTPLYAIGAVIFNPFMKLKLQRHDWIWIDQWAIALFCLLTLYETVKYLKRIMDNFDY